ncbi:MAG: hypothetical protein ACKO2N_14325 [Tabrizicola sp.]
MMKTSFHFLKVCSLSVALLGSVALITAVSTPDMAFAKSGNDNGGGKGGGNGNGNGNGGGNGNGNSKAEKSGGGSSKSEKSGGSAKSEKKSGGDATSTKTKTKSKTKSKKKDLAEELGVHPSELGALNAAHANENALKNASPNSRVGRIAAYRDAVVAGEALKATLAEKEAELDALTPPARSSDVVQTELDLAALETATAAGQVSELETALANADPADIATITQIEADLAAARTTLGEAEAAEAALEDELADAVAFETLEDEVADLSQKVEDQPELERSLLEAAANKEVTDEVEAAVKKLLGL